MWWAPGCESGTLRYPSASPEQVGKGTPLVRYHFPVSIWQEVGAGRSVRVRSGLGKPQALLVL